ncbi:hypothetical protein E3N88_04768 [Mikania micrantha]|uniref:Aminotransferase class V domain-containing protein n=1 Tax=Mikania micrantha TaxID=192012 RepID=A0A5N6PY39_9ASTR|nr:hypothetical protein E3N88_04768 [Mikania micrantha]
MDYTYAPGRNHLFVPGPVNIPEQVLRAMNRNNEDYRSPAIPALTKTLLEDVKKIFKTISGTPFLIPTTGTGAWESALTNTLSPGDRIVSFVIGQFSLLWVDQQKRLGFDVDVVESDWGRAADLDVLESKIAADTAHTIKAICIVHNETATGVTNNLASVRKILDEYQHPALFLVDGVSSICALDFRMDEWGVDVALTGSQKALSLPTGLGIVCASPKAIAASESAKSVRVFFDWKDYLKFYKMGTYWPYTPSIQLLYGLKAALDLIFEEGLDNVIARHTRLGTATRLAVEAWGLKNCTQKEEWFSDTVTAVVVPSYIDSSEVVRRGWKRYNLSLGLGLNKVAGKVFRIGHLGNLNDVPATAGVSCRGRDGAEGCGLPCEAGKWSGCCLCIPAEQHPNDSFKDLNPHVYVVSGERVTQEPSIVWRAQGRIHEGSRPQGCDEGTKGHHRLVDVTVAVSGSNLNR